MDAGIIRALATLESEPDNADALAQLAALAEGGGNGHGRGGEAAPDTAIRRALTEARQMHRDRGDYEVVARLIDLELGWETDKGRKADLYFEKGKILADELLREQDAVRCFERVLELRPEDETAEDTLGHIALVRDNWQKIAKKYLDEAKDSTDRQLTTSLYLSVAEIYAKYQPDDHVEKYLKRALEVEPRNAKASMRLERLYRGESRWDDLVKLLDARIEAAPTKDERVAAYLALADVQAKKLGLRAQAADSHKKALGIDPANTRALKSLIDHYTSEENWQALIRVYENALKARPRGESEIGVYLQIGMLWWKKLGNLESADEYWKRVRKAEPAHPAMLEFYRQYHAKEPAKLLAILQQAQKVEADPKRRLDLAVETAHVAEKSSGAVEKAIDLWKAVLKLDPHNQAAGQALKRLYEKTEKWNALLELLKERVEAVPLNEGAPEEAIDDRVERLLEVVAIYRDKLNLDVMVINTYTQILALRPDHAVALQAIAQKYEALGRWNDLIGILQRTADTTQDGQEKARLLRRIAALWIEKFGNFNQAVKPLEELYALQPVDPETVARLRDIYTRRRSWRALIDLERKEMERSSGAERRAKLVEIAKLAAERLGDAREAISIWNQVLALDENDVEALTALAQLYEREKRWLALAEVLRRLVRTADAKQQLILLERIGSIYAEKLGATDQAIPAYQEIVRRLPSHQKAVRTLRELFAQGGRFGELEQLYAESGQWEELCEVLSSVAERAGAVEEQIRLYLRVAELAKTKLDAPERAGKAYERILALDGQNADAAAELVPIYRASAKWARLLASYEILLGHATTDEERLEVLQDIRALCEDKLGSKGLAFTWCARAYALRPADTALEHELERLAQEAEAWEELVEIYTREIENERDDGRRAERHRRLGQLLLRLHHADGARRHFEALLASRPEDEEALATLEQIFTQAQSFPELLAIYKKREARAEKREPARRLDLLLKIAWIEEEKVSDLPAAIATYQKILEVDKQTATQLRALRALAKLYAEQGSFGDVVQMLELERALVKGDVDQEVALLLRAGELFEHQLARRPEALERYKAAYALQPGDKRVQAALERWLDPESGIDEDARVDVARLLGPMYQRESADREGARRLAASLEIILRSQKQAPAQLDLLRRLARLAEHDLDDPARAYGYAMRIFELEPADADNRTSLAVLAERLEKQDDFAVRLSDAETQAAKEGGPLARDLAWDLGQLFETRLGMPLDAEAAYQRVLERDPEHQGAQVALAQLYSGSERWKDLRALLLARKGRAHDTESRLSLLYQIADLDEAINDEDTAILDFVEILEIDPGAERAFRALDRLYSGQKKWRELDSLLDRRVPYQAGESGTAESRAHLKFRRAELKATRLEEPAEAVELVEQTLADEPRHEAARKLLEGLMRRPELRQRIARALEPLYLADEAWPKLALVLGAQREAAAGAEAAALLMRLAALQEEHLGARQLALTTWREALRLDPADPRVRENVERLATLLERPADLAQAWEEALAAADPKNLDLRGELLEKVAEIYEHDLRDVEKARSAWRRLFDLDPTHLSTARPAATALARLYETAEDWPRLIDVLLKQAEWASAPGERLKLLYRVGEIQERILIDPKAAIGTYREILEGNPEERPALDALERLHVAQSEWVEVIDVLRRRLDLSRDEKERRDLLWRMAQLTEKELGDVGDAIAGYHAVLDERPDDAPALEALARLYEREKRPVDLLDVLERQLTLAEGVNSPAQARIALRMRIATLLSGFGRRDQALERWAEVLALDDHHVQARAGLEQLLEDEDLRLRAAEILEPHYQAVGEHDKLVRLQELHARFAPDPRDRIGRLRRIAALEERAGNVAAAADALGRAARFAIGEPDLPSLLDDLERLLGDETRQKLVELYRELGPDILDAATQERVYLKVAAESQALGDRATAREYYRRVLDGAPEHPRALDALETVYQEGAEWEPLYEIYARRAELTEGDDERRRQYLLKQATLCEGPLDRPTEAVRAYEQVLELYPRDADASAALEAHYTHERRWVDLGDLLEKRLGFAEEIEEAVALRYRLAKLFDEELADSDRAVENYRATLGGDPTHEGAIRALEKFLDDDTQRVSAAEVLDPVYTSRHDWKGLARIYQIRLEAAADPRARLALTRRIARLHEEHLEDLDGAFTWYGKVFREDPADRANRDHLARLAGILDGWQRLAGLYEDFLKDGLEQGPMAVEVLRTLASIYHARLGDVDGARRAYHQLLTIDSGDEAAFANTEQLLYRAGRWQDLIDLYRDSAEQTPDLERKKALLFKQAAVVEEEVEDSAEAVDIYRAILDLDGDEARAIQALDRLYVQEKRWHDLIELLARRLERAESATWVALELRLAGIYEGELDDRPAAIDAYEEVLRRTERERGQAPQRMEAVRALERLIVDHDHTFRIAQILEPIYREQDAWQKLVVIYDAELEFIDDRRRRIELLRDIARLHEERGGDGALAFAALARAWSEEVEEGGEAEESPLYDELARLAKHLTMWRELSSTLAAAGEKTYDAGLQAKIHARLAVVKEQHLDDRAGAIDSWQKVTRARDDDPEAWAALERLYQSTGAARELSQVLEKRGALAEDAGEQKRIAYRAAELHEKDLGERDQAIQIWQRVLGLDDADARALDALERLYGEKGAFRDLAQIYARKLELLPEEAARRPLRFALAQVSEHELHDAFAAVDAYKGVLAAQPDDREALTELARLYAQEKLWPDHLETLDELSRHLPPAERSQVALRAAEVVERELAEPEAAVERYRDVLFAEAATAEVRDGARAALERQLAEERTRELAAAVLEPYYEGRHDHAELIALTELRLGGETEPSARRALLVRMAKLYETGTRDLQAAFVTCGRVLAEDAADAPAQAELERLAEALGAPGELARVYEERLSGTFDPEVQRQLAWKLGVLYETKLGDEERAIGAYHKTLELPGPTPEAEREPLAALDRLLTRSMRWRELPEVLEREAQAAADPNEQAEIFYRLGALKANELVDLDGSLAAFAAALERAPGHPRARQGVEKLLGSAAHLAQALDLLEPLYEDDANHEKILELAELRLGILHEAREKTSLLERIAERAEQKLADPARALDALARALVLMPDDSRLADEVERVARAAQMGATSAQVFEHILDSGELSRETARELGLRAARIWDAAGARDPGAVANAEKRYQGVLAVDQTNVEALEALDRIYRGRGDATALASVLVRRAHEELDLAHKKELYAEAARLHEGPLADAPGAIMVWRALLEVDESDAAALDALARLHEAAEQYQELVQILEEKARFAEAPATQAGLKGRIAALWAEKLGDLDRAVAAYRDLLDLVPDALAALEALEELERKRGDHLAVQEVLVRRLQAVGAGAPQIPIYRKLTRLALEKQDAPEDAIGYIHEILAIAPEDPEAQAELEALLERTGKFHDLVEVLTGRANQRAARGDAQGEIALLVRAADVWEQKLSSPESATEILERILERDPSSVRALSSLARIYESAHDVERCRATLERAIALAKTGKEQAELYFRIGRLEADASGEEAAEPWFAQALAADSEHAGAAAALETQARARGDFARVAELLAMRTAHATGADQRALDLELAKVLSEKVGRPGDALPYLERALIKTPDDPAVLEPLADLYFASGRLDEARPLYSALAERMQKARRMKDVARLRSRVGQIAEISGDAPGAIAEYNAALKIDPGHAQTLAALGRLHLAAGEWEPARGAFKKLLLANLDPQSGVNKADVYLALGEISERLGEGQKAIGMYERGLELDHGNARLKEALSRVKK